MRTKQSVVSLPQIQRGMGWTELVWAKHQRHDRRQPSRKVGASKIPFANPRRVARSMEQYESCEHGELRTLQRWVVRNGTGCRLGTTRCLRCYGMACMGCGYETSSALFGKEAP